MKILEPLSRKLKILEAIVERYVMTGEPVGSKSVCENLNISFSPATIRSEMADLSEVGYLFQPHISAGRVPSDQGYRLYINKLMKKKPLCEDEKNLINGVLSVSATDPESLFESAVKILSDITGFVAVITAPPAENSKVRDIQFVQTGNRSAMIVLMTSGGMIKNKLFKCDYDLNTDILMMFRKILNEKFRGEILSSVTPEFMNLVVGNDKQTAFLFLPVIDVLMKAAQEVCEPEVKVKGQKNLLSIGDISPETVINIFNFIEDRERLLSLFGLTGRSIKFIVGEENDYLELKNASVITSSYSIGGKSGTIGIIGPKRMDYSRVASQVQYVSAVVGAFLGRMLEN